MKPRKVAYVITGLAAGGAENVIYKLLSRHNPQQWQATVISLMPCAGLPLDSKIRALGIPVHSLEIEPGHPRPAALYRLLRILRALQPDLLSGWEVHGDLAVLAASYFHPRLPTLWNVCGSLDDRSTEKPATRALIRLLARLSHRPQRIVYNSHRSARQHEGMGYDLSRTVVIPNPFDCDLFRPDGEARASVRAELGLALEAPLIGMVARYHPVKDHATFLRAAQRVAEAHPQAHFLLAGMGVDGSNAALRSQLRELGLAGRVSLLGQRQDIPRLTAALDIACLTSRAEAFPNVIGEALACGVPCVATDVGDVARIVGESGRVVPPRAPEAFARALGHLLEMPVERRRYLGAQARAQVRACYDPDKIGAAVGDVYRTAIAETAGSPGRRAVARPTRGDRLKVLHILGDSKWGGGSLVTLAMAEAGRRAGWTVDLLTTDPPTIAAARGRGLGVVNLDVSWRDIRPWRDLKGLWRLRVFLKQAGYDLVHTHTSKAGLVGRLAAKLARVPVIVHTMHGFAIHERSPAGEKYAYAWLEKFGARCCHRIVTVSHFHRRWALGLGIAGEGKLVSIPNGSPEPAPVAGRAATRQDLGLADHHIAILSNTRLAAQKGLEDLLGAARLLRGEIAGRVRILLAGDGPERTALEQLARRLDVGHLVRFLGFRSDVADLLAAADLVALPSLREGLSMALLEAMAAGKPIVATSIGSIQEATQRGECAILVPVENPAALAEAITELVDDPERAACLGRRGREIYQRDYTLARMTGAYLDLYKDLIRTRLPGRGEKSRSGATAQPAAMGIES